jgi:alginate O-acetyltransferase complex protein AlgI
MLFSGIPFLYYFLPLILLLYFLVPKKLRNAALLLGSLVFYAWGEPGYVLLMITEILVGYLSGLFLDALRGKRMQKPVFAVSVAVPLFLLVYFKYADFLLENINALTGLSLPLREIVLPVGISFYTFQLISYQTDVYRGTVKVQCNPVSLAVYIAMFPQLIAGPIVRYGDMEKQLADRKTDFEGAAEGIRRFLLGLGKKVLLANRLGELCTQAHAAGEQSVLLAWLYAIAFTLQIYFDFSGYSDMAIGLGRILGFRFPENFRYPYVAESITDFWRRWHISLGAWFRDYVYIPLGGNRVSRLCHFRNILIVWLLTGIWHGAAWNFVLWGLFFALLLMIEKQWLLEKLKEKKIISHIYVLFFVIISFVIFHAESLGGLAKDMGSLFGAGGMDFVSEEGIYYLKSYGRTLLLAAFCATPFPVRIGKQLCRNKTAEAVWNLAEPVVLVVLLLVVTAYLVDGSFNPFLYFRF